MKTPYLILLKVVFLSSCSKEDYPPECQPRELTEIQKSNFGGKWIWQNTVIEQWFDIGSSNFYEVTPQSEGVEYYFALTDKGEYLGYRNDALIHELILNKSTVTSIDEQTLPFISFNVDCTNLKLNLSRFPQEYHLDTLFSLVYPINLDDTGNHLRSHANTFARE